MKIIEQIEKIGDMGKSKHNKQDDLTVAEVFHLWNHLVMRYEILETTNILSNFAKDEDLKEILDKGINILNEQINRLENVMKEFGIPFPERGAKELDSTINLDIINDKFIYKHIRGGIRTMIPSHVSGFLHSQSSKIRDIFKEFLVKELDVFDKFTEYGKLKSYTPQAPVYKPS